MFYGFAKRLFPEQMRRDVEMLWKGIRGEKPEPFSSRPKVDRSQAAPFAGRRLQIAEVRRETANAVSLVLEDPFGTPTPFEAGQFFTITWPPKSRPGEVMFEKRAYSGSSSALDPSRITITVKRVEGGAVSNAINDTAKVGEVVEILGPSGHFTVPEAVEELVLIGGGSGITPLMSIARTVLASRESARITLLFGNRNHDEIIFHADIQAMEQEHGERFRVRHALEQPSDRVSATHGRLDEETVQLEIDAISPGPNASFFICGPEPMMEAAERALETRGVAKERVKTERFVTLRRVDLPARTEHEASVVIAGTPHTVAVGGMETLLEAGLRTGVAMPFSCTVGGCAACRVRLREGSVTMDEPNCLTPDEVADGYVLACVSRLNGPVVVEVEDP